MSVRVVCQMVAALGLSACVQSNTMRVSQNEAVITTSAAPICGSVGASRAAQKQAAVETLRAGKDRYIILGAAAQDNVRTSQMGGSYYTTGTANSIGNYTNFNARTSYRPGPVIVSGSHDQQIVVHMFRDGEPGSDGALSARETLGPDWAEIVKKNVLTCS